jgi:threonine aldolase
VLVDLRSDTVTRPTPEMRRAMADAEVGDDGKREDPTVRALEEYYAARVGKEAAVFVPSGTMANQIALRVLAAPGTQVIAGRRQHVVAYESGAAARNAGVQFHTLDDEEGILDPAAVAWARDAVTHHQPPCSVVAVENTHMAASGAPYEPEALAALAEAAGPLPIHMDGARLFNAEVALGKDAALLAAPATTVMTCLSKGLCAPVGSVLAGPAALEPAMRLERQRFGGSMRQAGVIAAPGLVALETMVERLAEDHARARRLAEAVATRWPDAGVDPERVRTNIVTFTHHDPEQVLAHLRGRDVLADTIAPGTLRLVTHHDVDDEGVAQACAAIEEAPR